MEPEDHNLVKVLIPLLGTAVESGYESESVWAEPLGNDQYLIWNVPVFAYNLEMRAVVKCRPDPDGGLPIVTAVIKQGDCRGVRVYFEDSVTDEQIQSVLDLFTSKNALVEKHGRDIWAFGLRTSEDYAWVGPTLQPFVDNGTLTFESNFQPEEPGYDGPVV